MTATAKRPSGPPPPPYELAHEPDGTSWTARENLADILRREMLGPRYGADEVIQEAPENFYLLGRVAPAKLRPLDADPTPVSYTHLDVYKRQPVRHPGFTHVLARFDLSPVSRTEWNICHLHCSPSNTVPNQSIRGICDE